MAVRMAAGAALSRYASTLWWASNLGGTPKPAGYLASSRLGRGALALDLRQGLRERADLLGRHT